MFSTTATSSSDNPYSRYTIQSTPLLRDIVPADTMPGDEEKMLGEGFDGSACKPITAKQLNGAVNQMLSPMY